ncbi:bicaudal-D-related protein 2-like [Cheilinus undulatus]|uniref:bicaudal-D-related protein 2-like n=1 Tax=Cheilinus undulatus TaxID=241271 RepID=UPI001BD47BEB|nr:bicaudal-D-related protein 2-like [Cheilinus undulatus]
MNFSQSFSALNEQLRPRITTSHQLYSSLTRVEDRQWGSLKVQPTYYRPTILPTEPATSVTLAEQEPEEAADQEDVASEGDCADVSLCNNSCLITGLNLRDMCEEELLEKDSNTSPTEEKDIPGELTSEETGEPTESVSSEGGSSSLQRSYLDGTLPDLIRSGRPLGRRRTLGPVSDTLKEVRREVELSRRRSIKLKAQVDKLQENRDGRGWSQHRERVTEEVLSVLRLLHPLTEQESSLPEPSDGENRLDHALVQLQNVARKLAISHTKESNPGKGSEDSTILQQALRDRDEAIEKKKAMEEELLRSKSEMMLLNNQVLEAVQKRLEMSLELEAWKEDVQLMLHQQLQIQQQAEQAQKKPSRLGILRRNNKPPIQRPSNFPLAVSAPSTTNSNQIFVSKSATSTPSTSPSQRNWRDKLRRGKSSRQGDQDAVGLDSDSGKGDDFEVVSLD